MRYSQSSLSSRHPATTAPIRSPTPIRIEIEAEGEVMKVVLRSICRLQEVFGMVMELGHIKDDDDNVRPPSCASMEAKVASHLAALVSHTIAACRTAKRLRRRPVSTPGTLPPP
uniref:Uncharacterized protein n=1 Tax=Oryza barthii TaxID=65489 RepID=A0A0D3HEM6_9ORYZ